MWPQRSVNSIRRLWQARGYSVPSTNFGGGACGQEDLPFHPGVVHPPDTRAPETKLTNEYIRKSRKRKLEIPLPPVKPKPHINGLDVTANIYTFGNGSHGALGNGSYKDVSYPTQLLALQRIPIKHVASGWGHSVAVSEDGRIYRWGWIDDVKTTFTNANMKRRVPRLTLASQSFGRHFSPESVNWFFRDAADLEPRLMEQLEGIPIKKAICGCGYTIALADDGRVYSWGHGRWGNLGHPIFVTWTEIFPIPKLVDRLRDVRIVDIACGYVHTLFLDDEGGLWGCGPGYNGRLGVGEGSARGEYPIPLQISPLWEQRMHHVNKKVERRLRSRGRNVKIDDYIPYVTKIGCGHKHSCILTDDGKVWCFGAGIFGALGQGHNFTDQWWPTQVTALKDEFVIDIKCGQHHTVALTDKGEVWTWGMSRHGQCGRPREDAFMLTKYEELGEDMSVVDYSPPTDSDADIIVENDPLAMRPGKLQLPEGVIPYAIAAGWYQTSVIDQEGRLWTWGSEDGRLEQTPTHKMWEITPGIREVTHGWLHTVVVTRRSSEDTWHKWHSRPESETKPEKPPPKIKDTLLLATDDEDEDKEDITLIEAFRMARAERLEEWSRADNIILERSPEEDERRFEITVEEREVKYQARIAAAEEQKRIEAEEQKKLEENSDMGDMEQESSSEDAPKEKK